MISADLSALMFLMDSSHLFERDHEASQADWLVDCIVSRVSRSLHESVSRAAVVQTFQEALQAVEAAIPSCDTARCMNPKRGRHQSWRHHCTCP